ncbi:MAG: hypothetical protein KatS3mg076_3050 [Candidatus Binatia bacterium]|nr:MAG: hypothetical protein KatS3mg076_3050 [Candidatus Binatia bacterium]
MPTLDPYSVLAQVVTFFVLWAVLRRWLFEPMLSVLDEREKRTRGTMEMAQGWVAEAREAEATYDRKLLTARREAARHAEEVRRALREEEREVLESARNEAAARIARARSELVREVEGARARLEEEARRLGTEIRRAILSGLGAP